MNIVHILLRLSLTFAFLYPPIHAWFYPYDWIGYFPDFMRDIVSDTVLLHAFGVVEIGIAFWIISGWRIRVPALVAAVLLFAIVLCNPNNFPVLFRDLSIAGIALALALWPSYLHNGGTSR